MTVKLFSSLVCMCQVVLVFVFLWDIKVPSNKPAARLPKGAGHLLTFISLRVSHFQGLSSSPDHPLMAMCRSTRHKPAPKHDVSRGEVSWPLLMGEVGVRHSRLGQILLKCVASPIPGVAQAAGCQNCDFEHWTLLPATSLFKLSLSFQNNPQTGSGFFGIARSVLKWSIFIYLLQPRSTEPTG